MPYTNSTYTKQEKQQLLAIARSSIGHGLEKGKPCNVNPENLPESLREQRATFVTLNKSGQLRGCIGVLDARYPLAMDTAQNAFAAAFQDHRFSPLISSELDHLTISISVLGPAYPLEFAHEQELLEKIRPGQDGLILQDGYNRGVFLPSVWESLPEKLDFLRQLKRKAGLPMDHWSEQIRVSCFQTQYFSEGND